MKDKAYYYCYRRVIKDYGVYVQQLAQADVVERQCAYCHQIIAGPATYYVPGPGEVDIAGAMVDHIKYCEILVSSRERINVAIKKHVKEHKTLTGEADIRSFYTEASYALSLSHKKVCSEIKLVNNANKISTKAARAKANELPIRIQL
jgi:hypothetical protein